MIAIAAPDPKPVTDRQRPNNYQGNSKKAKQFLRDFNRVADLNHWNDDYKVKTVSFYLDTCSKRWYEALKLYDQS